MKIRLGKRQRIAAIVIAAVLACAVGAFFFVRGLVLPLYRFAKTSGPKGIDVSNYQGNISWATVSKQKGVDFVYMKATEGKSFQDPYFKKNWSYAGKYGIPAGAYHFFSLSSSGADQAKNFISLVPKAKGNLPPVADVEVSVTDKAAVETELNVFLKAIQNHYGQRPVLYVNNRVYKGIGEDYKSYPIWICDYSGQKPKISWKFWQYTEEGRVKGIDGAVDMDVFNGNWFDFRKTLLKK